MPPQSHVDDSQTLLALLETVRLRLEAERTRTGGFTEVSPLLAGCLKRARGHVELAAEALAEARPEHALRGDDERTPLLEVLPLSPLDPDMPPICLPSRPEAPEPLKGADLVPEGRKVKPPGWVHGHVSEIKKALGLVLDDLLEEPEEPEDGLACAAPSAAPEFSGRSDSLSIPDLIGFFQAQGKTGVLEFEGRNETFRLEFSGGALIHAASNNSPDGERLGEILERRGVLTRTELHEFLGRVARGEKLGDALVREDVVPSAEIKAALQDQVFGIFVRLAKTVGGAFTFREGGIDTQVSDQVRYNVTGLLLECARQMDEARESA